MTLKNILIHLETLLSTVPMRILEGLSSTKNLVVLSTKVTATNYDFSLYMLNN